ncbi:MULTISPECIES: FG-GAP repeat domain-containing protein [Streptomyces griseus group]|uniref:FG-GAP repeat domain-containing protein n=1 Tax=Streptomyces griseus group TaxID=629295 RepID=UPI0004AADB74|nr:MULTISPECIES: VCBS repeat-containing protein [Streptomyces fimicarius subgroup]
MAQRALTNGVVAAALVMSVTAALGPTAAAAAPDRAPLNVPEAFAATAAAKAAAEPVIIPPVMSQSVQPFNFAAAGRPRHPDGAGTAGVFHRVSGPPSAYVWTRFADGRTFPAGPSGTAPVDKVHGTGTDVIVYQRGNTFELRDMAAGTTRTLTLPDGLLFSGVFGRTVVAVRIAPDPTGDEPRAADEAHLLDVREDGTVRDRTVEGLPADTRLLLADSAVAGDSTSVALRYVTGGAGTLALVDVASARVGQRLGAGVKASGNAFLLTPRHLLFYVVGTGTTIGVLPRSDIGGTPRSITSVPPADRYSSSLRVVGDWLIHNRGSGPLMATPLDGGPSRQLLKASRQDIAAAEDGSVTVVGGVSGQAGDREWGVHRITEGPDGVPVPERVIDLAPLPRKIQGIGLSGGRLTVADSRLSNLREATVRTLSVSGTPTYGPRVPARITFDTACGPEDPDCHAMFGAIDGGVTFLARRGGAEGDEVRNSEGNSFITGASGGTLTDADGTYAVYTDEAAGVQTVYRSYGPEKILTRKPVASALSTQTLWSAAEKPGTVTETVLETGRTKQTVDLGTGCAPRELQALGRWLYWSCGESGPAGVYDLTTKQSLPVPADEALLGDGYLVRHDKAAGKLVLTDLVTGVGTGTAPERVLADLPATGNAQRRVAWTVDKHGGHVAYVDSGQRVHVVPTGVPTQPLWVRDERSVSQPAGESGHWEYSARLSKPVGSWKAILVDRRTGKTVRTLTGGEARDTLEIDWDARDGSRRLVVNGAYDWVLTAQPADGHGRALVRTGKVDIAYADPAWRDFGGRDGLGDLFVVVEDQSLGMRRGKLPGTVGPYGGYWGILDAPATGIVPTGDLRGDRCNDYLVVNSDGSLYRLDGTCDDDGQYGFLTDPVKIGTGWKAYDVYSPGDLNGDGVADVLARQKSTGSLYLYASNGAGKLTAGVLIGTGWKSLTVVAAGDLTGDGIGDVLARDSSGVLWRYAGTGAGKLAAKQRIGSGWGQYNAIAAVGDITGDGRNDLFARDKAGVLWRYEGTGDGLFAPREKLSPGWQGYLTLF